MTARHAAGMRKDVPRTSHMTATLNGLQVLVVDDEIPVLLMIEDMLTSLGCDVVYSATRVAEALDFLKTTLPQAAVLDINVAGVSVYPVATELAARNVPFVFSSGYGLEGISQEWRSRPVLHKPYLIDELARTLGNVVDSSRTA